MNWHVYNLYISTFANNPNIDMLGAVISDNFTLSSSSELFSREKQLNIKLNSLRVYSFADAPVMSCVLEVSIYFVILNWCIVLTCLVTTAHTDCWRRCSNMVNTNSEAQIMTQYVCILTVWEILKILKISLENSALQSQLDSKAKTNNKREWKILNI